MRGREWPRRARRATRASRSSSTPHLDHEPVEPVELSGEPHLHRVGANLPERAGVLAEGTLEGEHADPGWASVTGRSVEVAFRRLPKVSPLGPPSRGDTSRGRPGYQPRSSSRSDSASEPAEIPTIGAPSPDETSARILASA